NLNTNPITGLILLLIAVSLFWIGHKIEGNFRVMTLIILFKYLRSRKVILSNRVRRSDAKAKKLVNK
ncbi:MAG: hypothetical protein WAZ77_20240, partial [Candidatus Nitrosopolaris sp.]